MLLHILYNITRKDTKSCSKRFDFNEKSCRVKENTVLTQIFMIILLLLFLLMSRVGNYIFYNSFCISDIIFKNVFKGIIVVLFIAVLKIMFLLFHYRILSGVGEHITPKGETGDYIAVEKFDYKSCKFETFILVLNMLVLVLCYIIILFTNKITLVVYVISITYLFLNLPLILHESKITKKACYTDYVDNSDILIIHLKRNTEHSTKLEFLIDDIEFFVKLNQDIYIWDWDWDSNMICHPIAYVFPRNNIDYIEIGYLKIVYQNGSWIQVVT